MTAQSSREPEENEGRTLQSADITVIVPIHGISAYAGFLSTAVKSSEHSAQFRSRVGPPYKKAPGTFVYGGRGRTRTCDQPVRSRLLYPAELRVLIPLSLNHHC